MKTWLRWLLRLLYRFQAFGTAVLNTPGPVVLLPNHVSWWDWLLIGVCLDDDWRFVTSSTSAHMSWVHRRLMVNKRTFPVDMTSPFAVKRMAEYLQKGGRLVLFPEGQLSRTGAMMKLYDGTGFLIGKTKPKVITAYIRGAHRLPFSRHTDRKRWFPNLSVHFSEPLIPPQIAEHGAARIRNRLTSWVRTAMIQQQFQTEVTLGPQTIANAVLKTMREWPRKIALQDHNLNKLTYREFEIGASLLAQQWSRFLKQDTNRVGVLLPNVNVMPVVLLSLWNANRIPAILNYSMGTGMLVHCARLAGFQQLITSKAFIERAKLELDPLKAEGVEIVFLEDVRQRITPRQKVFAALQAWFKPLNNPAPHPEDTAAILFTSGSESKPKGVELTQRNLVTNVRQMLSVIDVWDSDRCFNALPLFHSFGLTVGLLLPLVRGVFVQLYVSPLHYRTVPAAFYNLDCTILFGTNTFLMGYARKAHPYDFRALRYVFEGGEKVQETTARLWMEKFGIRILEGYGATECSPCLTLNVPLAARPGSVGQFLPGIEWRIESVEGIKSLFGQTTGRLFVRGPNIMHGYLNKEEKSRFVAMGGWYDTGDIVKVDEDGFAHMLGRTKRFAKISGEMVSLAAVEDSLAGAFPQYGTRFAAAILARPDAVKGERLIVVTNEAGLTLTEVRGAIQAAGLSNLAAPKDLKIIREMPLLATGKVNLQELEKLI